MKLVYVEWLDACSSSHWQSHDEAMEWAMEPNDPYIRQVGWVLHEDDKLLVLASRQGRNIFGSDTKEDQSFGLLQKIPKTWIRKRKVLKI